jgi:hypothetical protein
LPADNIYDHGADSHCFIASGVHSITLVISLK